MTQRPLKILTIGHSYVVSSNRVTVEEIAKQPDIDIDIICPNYFKGDLRSLEVEPNASPNTKLIPLPVVGSGRIHTFFYRKLKKALQANQYDAIHIWEEPYILAGFQIAWLAKKFNIPYFFRTAQSIPKAYPPPFNFFEKYCVKHASAWVAGASLVHQALIDRGYDQQKSAIINLAVSPDQFKPNKEAARQRLKDLVALNGPIIGYIGRLEVEKGLDDIMAALEKIDRPWTFVGLGSGSYHEKLMTWASRNNFSDRVCVTLLKHDEVSGILPAFDMMLAPSRTMSNWKEQFGRMIIEAFACKVAVIGSDSGEIPRVIDQAGLVVPESNSEALREAIDLLLNDEEKRETLAEAGYQRFHQEFSNEIAAKKFTAIYKKITDHL